MDQNEEMQILLKEIGDNLISHPDKNGILKNRIYLVRLSTWLGE